jgi:hypothetical protein
MRYATQADRLDDAVASACREAGTSNLLAFDGAVGGFNVSQSLAEFLNANAGAVEEKVEANLLPKWCRQRNLKYDGN